MPEMHCGGNGKVEDGGRNCQMLSGSSKKHGIA